ncbi:MAG: hypothetical protein CTY18_09385 [Methylomonas sp.]|nr:MAG: hypothetical protein CTY18_09385 [Methylomonas sp.]
MVGWFDISKTNKGKFRFELRAGNAEILLTSELYQVKIAAENGIAAVQKHCAKDELYERKQSDRGKFYFILNAGNQKILATSPFYPSAQARDQGIESVKLNGVSDTIKDNT